MNDLLPKVIFAGGVGQLIVLIASALVPFQLNWLDELRSLSRLHRQMYWVYAAYIVLSIVAFGLISILHSSEVASGSGLARAFSLYVAVFWGLRLALQPVFDVKDHLTTWWLRCGYHSLTIVFLCLALIYGWAALRP